MSQNVITNAVGEFTNDLTGISSNNAFNAAEAEKQRKWEEEMSNTAYQRAVTDMKKAGLSPGLMYENGGNGATTPTGTSARASSGNSMLMNLINLGVENSVKLALAEKEDVRQDKRNGIINKRNITEDKKSSALATYYLTRAKEIEEKIEKNKKYKNVYDNIDEVYNKFFK